MMGHCNEVVGLETSPELRAESVEEFAENNFPVFQEFSSLENENRATILPPETK